jgi:hypothetical protein
VETGAQAAANPGAAFVAPGIPTSVGITDARLLDFCPSHRQMPVLGRDAQSETDQHGSGNALDRAANGWSAQDLADPGDGM